MSVTIASNLSASSNNFSIASIAIPVAAITNDILLIEVGNRPSSNIVAPIPTITIVSGLNNYIPTTLELFSSPDGVTPNNFNTLVAYFVVPSDGFYTPNISTNPVSGQLIAAVQVIRGADPLNISHDLTFSNTPQLSAATSPNVTGELIIDTININTSNGNITRPASTQLYQHTATNFAPGLRMAGFSRTDVEGSVSYDLGLSTPTIYATISVGFSAPFICVAKDTNILMADRTIKSIQYVQRGDLIAGDLNGTINKVARVVRTKMSGITPIALMKFEKDSIAENQPNNDLIISTAHPILHNGNRYRAKCLRKRRGAKYYNKNNTKARDILPLDVDAETYSLYNIQFEHDGYFVANGVVIDSVPVLSDRYPLPRELYFNPELYNVEIADNKPKLVRKYIPG